MCDFTSHNNTLEEGWCAIHITLDEGWCDILHHITMDCNEGRCDTLHQITIREQYVAIKGGVIFYTTQHIIIHCNKGWRCEFLK